MCTSQQFGDPYVIGWGFILYLCVAAKLPLALYVPQFEDFKKGAGYNPFLRDRVITSLAMTCRGEFSFIIAAFALGEGLFTARMYAAIVWAVLLSCISSPFMLLNLIKYFDTKRLAYLASTNPIKLGKEADGVAPFFLHVKVKAPAFGGMQESFRKLVNELGLEVIERRTNRDGRGLNATVQTDLFVRDTTITTRLLKIGAQRKIKNALTSAEAASGAVTTKPEQEGLKRTMSGCFSGHSMGRSIRDSFNSLSQLSLEGMEKVTSDKIAAAAEEEDNIFKRCDAIEKKIETELGDGADVAVDLWNPWPWTEVLDKIACYYGADGGISKDDLEVFVSVFDKIDADGGGSIDQNEMYEALTDAGLDITEEGVLTLVAMIDEDGNGKCIRLATGCCN